MSKFISISRSASVCLAVIMLCVFFSPAAPYAQEEKSTEFSTAKDHWTLLGGYGTTHRNLGDTNTRVQEVDLILQYGYFLTGEAGKSWYKVRHEVLLELPFYTVFHPKDAIMTGFNVLACWDFTSSEKMVPYIFAGGGMLYTNLDIPGLGSELNGNYQAGLGLHYFIKKQAAINFNYRLHHISNANTHDPNEPLNASKFLVGMTFLM